MYCNIGIFVRLSVARDALAKLLLVRNTHPILTPKFSKIMYYYNFAYGGFKKLHSRVTHAGKVIVLTVNIILAGIQHIKAVEKFTELKNIMLRRNSNQESYVFYSGCGGGHFVLLRFKTGPKI